MKNFSTLILCILLITGFSLKTVFAVGIDKDKNKEHNKKVVYGKVLDKKTGETLAGAKVYIEETQQTVFTDLDGNFEINAIETGTYNIIINYISYKENRFNKIKIDTSKNKILKFSIE